MQKLPYKTQGFVLPTFIVLCFAGAEGDKKVVGSMQVVEVPQHDDKVINSLHRVSYYSAVRRTQPMTISRNFFSHPCTLTTVVTLQTTATLIKFSEQPNFKIILWIILIFFSKSSTFSQL